MDRALKVTNSRHSDCPRYPLDPLLRLARLGSGRPAWAPEVADGFSHRDLALVLGVTTKTICRWSKHGVPRWSADRAAVCLGLVPYLVWPEWS